MKIRNVSYKGFLGGYGTSRPKLNWQSSSQEQVVQANLGALETEILAMGFLGGLLIHAYVVLAGCFQIVVAQNLLYKPNRTTIEEERRRHGVPQDMRRYFLQKTRPCSGDSEPLSDSGILQALAIRQDKQPLCRVPAMGDKLLNPCKRPSVEEHGPFLVTLADDAGFPRLEIHGGTRQRERLRDPHARR